jgi:hypothetical protein
LCIVQIDRVDSINIEETKKGTKVFLHLDS